MSHEVETMAYANEVPWHGLGANVSDNLTSEQFLKAAGLDWTLDRHPLFAEIEGERVAIPNKSAFIRSTDRKVMTVASNNWRPLQNADMLGFMDRYVQAGGAKLETAGALNGGKIVWGLAKLGHSFETRPGDRTEGYILFTSPHIVGRSISLRTTSVRVVCANTLAMAESAGGLAYTQNHLSDFRMDEARQAIAEANEAISKMEARSRTLDSLKLSLEDAVRKVIVPVFTPEVAEDEAVMEQIMLPEVMPRRAIEILHSIVEAPGAIRDTAWGVLNGITHWCDHMAGNDTDRRMTRSWTGDLAAKKLQAEELLFEMADQ